MNEALTALGSQCTAVVAIHVLPPWANGFSLVCVYTIISEEGGGESYLSGVWRARKRERTHRDAGEHGVRELSPCQAAFVSFLNRRRRGEGALPGAVRKQFARPADPEAYSARLSRISSPCEAAGGFSAGHAGRASAHQTSKTPTSRGQERGWAPLFDGYCLCE